MGREIHCETSGDGEVPRDATVAVLSKRKFHHIRRSPSPCPLESPEFKRSIFSSSSRQYNERTKSNPSTETYELTNIISLRMKGRARRTHEMHEHQNALRSLRSGSWNSKNWRLSQIINAFLTEFEFKPCKGQPDWYVAEGFRSQHRERAEATLLLVRVGRAEWEWENVRCRSQGVEEVTRAAN